MDFPIYKYPTKASTDPEVLYRSLGSFWTQVFQERPVIKGYTIALAEELIQRYYDLLEVVSSYSVKETPVYHREKWKPLRIYRSSFDAVPFVFKQHDATFGAQGADSTYYRDVTFQFGEPKRPSAVVYTHYAGADFKDFGVIADRIFNPSSFFIKGTDVICKDGILYFNQNIFDNPTVPKANVILENGNKKTFTDSSGVIHDEQLIILWAYHADIDKSILFNNFGYLFNLHLNNDAFFKEILKAIFDLYVDGPTVNNIISICASFLDISPVLESQEVIEEVFNDGLHKYVITDKNAYKFSLTDTILPTVIPGRVVHAGDMLTDAINYYDNLITPSWWKNSTTLKAKLALSQFLFLGNYSAQLVVSNSLDIVTLDSNGNIVFPLIGTPEDLTTFHTYLNLNQSTIKPLLGLVNPGDSVPIQPVDFLMENFLKTNTVLLNFKFSTNVIQAAFLSLLPILLKQMPPYVYVIFGLDLVIPDENYSNLNNAVTITFNVGDELLNADGSNNIGKIENLAPYGYRNVKERLFEIDLGIPGQPYEIVGASDIVVDVSADIAAGRFMQVTSGVPLKQPPVGASTTTFNKLLLLDLT